MPTYVGTHFAMCAADKGRAYAAQFSVFFEHRASAKIDRKQLIDAFVDHVPKTVRLAMCLHQHFDHVSQGILYAKTYCRTPKTAYTPSGQAKSFAGPVPFRHL